MQELKIVFVGRMGAGKSTAIRQVSSITPVNTDVKNLSGIESSKAETTVGIDYGRLQLENDCWVNLFGVPGQERFRSLWGVVSRGADGIVLLVNNSSAQPIDDCKEYLNTTANGLATEPSWSGSPTTISRICPTWDTTCRQFRTAVSRYPFCLWMCGNRPRW